MKKMQNAFELNPKEVKRNEKKKKTRQRKT